MSRLKFLPETPAANAMSSPSTPKKRALTIRSQPHHTPSRASPSTTPQSTPSKGSRASTMSSQTSKKESKPKNSNLPLPPELRDQILTYILTMESAPVEYLPPKIRAQKTAYALSLSRSPPTLSPHQVALRNIYLALSFTSKGMKEDATRVLFYVNEWFVRISLARDLSPKGMGVFKGRNGVGELKGTFGEGSLGWVRDLRVKIVSEDLRAEERMKGFLRELVQTLKQSRVLRKLVVQWANYYSVDGRMDVQGRKREIKRVRRMRRRREGPRRAMPNEELWKKWENEERILAPLLGLRGVPEVAVVGCVSDEWAEHLEGVMMSKEGPVANFKRKKVSEKPSTAPPDFPSSP